MRVLPEKSDIKGLVNDCKAEISDEYRAYEDDDEPGIQLTIGWDGKKDWGYQMGGEGYVPDQAKHPYQAAVRVQRDTDAERLASDIRGQLKEAPHGLALFGDTISFQFRPSLFLSHGTEPLAVTLRGGGPLEPYHSRERTRARTHNHIQER